MSVSANCDITDISRNNVALRRVQLATVFAFPHPHAVRRRSAGGGVDRIGPTCRRSHGRLDVCESAARRISPKSRIPPRPPSFVATPRFGFFPHEHTCAMTRPSEEPSIAGVLWTGPTLTVGKSAEREGMTAQRKGTPWLRSPAINAGTPSKTPRRSCVALPVLLNFDYPSRVSACFPFFAFGEEPRN